MKLKIARELGQLIVEKAAMWEAIKTVKGLSQEWQILSDARTLIDERIDQILWAEGQLPEYRKLKSCKPHG